MSELEFHIMLKLWNCILSEFHKVSKSLQDPEISLAVCATLYSSVSAFIDSLKKDFGNIENEAKSHVPNVDYGSTSKRARKRHFDELSDPAEPEEQLYPQDTFQLKSFNPILEALESNISKRAEVYTFIAQTFSFLTDLESSEEMMSMGVKNLIEAYPEDVNILDYIIY